MKRCAWLTVCFVLVSYCSFSQQHVSIQDFEFLVEKIRNDYPGYEAKVTPALFALEDRIRHKLELHPDSSFYYFSEYTSYFRDGHLRMGWLGGSSAPQSESVTIPVHRIDRDSLLRKNRDSQNLEGLWVSNFGEEIAILRSAADTNSFDGVFLSEDEVFFNFTPLADTIFAFTAKGVAPGFPKKSLALLRLNRKILEIHHSNHRFTRKSNDDIYDQAVTYTFIPSCPNGRNNYIMASVLDDSTFFMRIPGFYDYDKERIEEMLTWYRDDIRRCPYFIIDLRGNSGGQDPAYEALLPLLYTHPFVSKGVEWYASAGNIEDFETALKEGDIVGGEEGIAWTKALIREMKKHRGGFVIHPYDQGESDTVVYDTVYAYPRRVGILIDKSNASAAERFLLFAKNSAKVTLFGNEHTAGILDYSNAVPHTLPSGRYELVLPMTRSLDLPDHPIDNIGIAPDCHIPFPRPTDLYDKLDSWVYFVRNYFQLEDDLKQEDTE